MRFQGQTRTLQETEPMVSHMMFWPRRWLHSTHVLEKLSETELKDNELICLTEEISKWYATQAVLKKQL